VAAAYPTSNPSFSTKATNDVIAASHINGLQDEIIAIGTALRTSLQHHLLFTDATFDIGASGATRPRDLFLSRNLVIGGTFTPAGVLTAAAQPRAHVQNNGAQSVPTGTVTALTFDTETTDVGAMYASGTPTRLTIPAGGDGLYLVHAWTNFVANATGYRQVLLKKNGVTFQTAASAPVSSAAVATQLHAHLLVSAVAGDYFEVFVVQSSGGNLNVGDVSGYTASNFQIVKLW
jgi:hypothetical protein